MGTVVPKDLVGYFTASSAVAGTLIGLLFVAITLRYDAIFGAAARSRAVAAAAFTALTNALALSLWALIPHVDLGYPAAVIALFSVFATARTHFSGRHRRDTSTASFVVALVVYGYQFANGVVLVALPHDSWFVFSLAYTVYAAFVTGLSRSWQLLQPDGPGGGGMAGAGSDAGPGSGQSGSAARG